MAHYLTNPLETTNTKLAAALSAVGIPLSETVPMRLLTGDRGDSCCFTFQDKSPCGEYITEDLIKIWDDGEWHERNPDHPFAYLQCAARNEARLLDCVKSGIPIVAVQKNGKIGFVSYHAPDAVQRLVEQELKRKRRHAR